MKIIADLHLHSKYSRATSKDLDIKNLAKWAKVKGLNLLGTGDFTHPKWIKELKSVLKDEGNGIYTAEGMNFVLQSEVSLIYTDGGKGRRVHNIILAPNFDVVDQITEYFLKHGRIDYDGRPIFKISCPELVDNMMKISSKIEVIPAHAWTPWFGILGSMGGFDSIEEAFKDQVKHVHAIETGLSSDPPMNWRLSKLDKFALISCSDSHSFWPWRIGREATIFDSELSYDNLIKSIRTKEGLRGTIEVDPAYGKYHYDGHRNCNVCLSPKQSKELNKICPKCGKEMTIGVEYRVEELADREEGSRHDDAKEFYKLIPLSEIIAKSINAGVATKKVWEIFNNLIKSFDNELNILLNVPQEELEKVVDSKLAEIIIKNRKGEIEVKPGYDGVYGEPIFSEAEKENIKAEEYNLKHKQLSLSNF